MSISSTQSAAAQTVQTPESVQGQTHQQRVTIPAGLLKKRGPKNMTKVSKQRAATKAQRRGEEARLAEETRAAEEAARQEAARAAAKAQEPGELKKRAHKEKEKRRVQLQREQNAREELLLNQEAQKNRALRQTRRAEESKPKAAEPPIEKAPAKEEEAPLAMELTLKYKELQSAKNRNPKPKFAVICGVCLQVVENTKERRCQHCRSCHAHISTEFIPARETPEMSRRMEAEEQRPKLWKAFFQNKLHRNPDDSMLLFQKKGEIEYYFNQKEVVDTSKLDRNELRLTERLDQNLSGDSLLVKFDDPATAERYLNSQEQNIEIDSKPLSDGELLSDSRSEREMHCNDLRLNITKPKALLKKLKPGQKKNAVRIIDMYNGIASDFQCYLIPDEQMLRGWGKIPNSQLTPKTLQKICREVEEAFILQNDRRHAHVENQRRGQLQLDKVETITAQPRLREPEEEESSVELSLAGTVKRQRQEIDMDLQNNIVSSSEDDVSQEEDKFPNYVQQAVRRNEDRLDMEAQGRATRLEQHQGWRQRNQPSSPSSSFKRQMLNIQQTTGNEQTSQRIEGQTSPTQGSGTKASQGELILAHPVTADEAHSDESVEFGDFPSSSNSVYQSGQGEEGAEYEQREFREHRRLHQQRAPRYLRSAFEEQGELDSDTIQSSEVNELISDQGRKIGFFNGSQEEEEPEQVVEQQQRSSSTSSLVYPSTVTFGQADANAGLAQTTQHALFRHVDAHDLNHLISSSVNVNEHVEDRRPNVEYFAAHRTVVQEALAYGCSREIHQVFHPDQVSGAQLPLQHFIVFKGQQSDPYLNNPAEAIYNLQRAREFNDALYDQLTELYLRDLYAQEEQAGQDQEEDQQDQGRRQGQNRRRNGRRGNSVRQQSQNQQN